MIFLIIVFSAILRLINLNQSLWLDEAINVLAAKNNTFWGMITEYVKYDFHPPLYFAILWLWTKFFGYSEIAVRVPSLIFGILTILLVYHIGRKLHSKTLGLIAALLMAVNPLHIYYSQEARMYSLAAFAVCLNYFLFLKLIKGDRVNFLHLIFTNLLVLSSDYVAYLIIPSQFFYLIFFGKKYLKTWLMPVFSSGLITVFWLPILLTQLSIGSQTALNIPVWREIVGSFGIKPVILTYVKFIIGRINHPNDLIYALLFLPIGLLVLFLIWRALKFLEKKIRALLLIWLLVPIILALFISLIVPIYSYFRLLFVLPAFLLLISYGIISFKQKLKVIILSVFLIQIVSSSIYLFNPIFHREDWKGMVSFLKTVPQGKMLFESSDSFAPFDYYAKDSIKGVGALKKFPAEKIDDVKDLKNELGNTADVFLINYLVDISDPKRLVQENLIELGYQQVNIYNFNGVGFVYHYTQ